MKKVLAALLLVIWVYVLFSKGYLTPGRYLSANTHKISESYRENTNETLKPPFDSGEKFAYLYVMGPVRAGDAELTFVGEAAIEGKKAYLIKFKSQVGTFYDLENIYAETGSFYPIYVERNIKNLGVTTKIKERYDQKNYKVEITKKDFLKTKTTVIEKKSPIHNALLLMYYCRKIPLSELKPGYKFDIVLPVDEFKITLTKIEKIKVPAGTFEAYLFESNPKKIKLWIAKDEKRTPLKMENLTSFGPSSIILKNKEE